MPNVSFSTKIPDSYGETVTSNFTIDLDAIPADIRDQYTLRSLVIDMQKVFRKMKPEQVRALNNTTVSYEMAKTRFAKVRVTDEQAAVMSLERAKVDPVYRAQLRAALDLAEIKGIQLPDPNVPSEDLPDAEMDDLDPEHDNELE